MGLDDLVYGLYERRLAHDLSPGDIPRHVGVILDGNRRWATEQGSSSAAGHRAGAAQIAEFLDWCDEVGVEVVTLWMLSTDNLARPSEELDPLLRIIEGSVHELAATGKWAIRHVGAKDPLPERTRQVLERAEARTAGIDGMTVNVAVGYGGRQELVDAVRALLHEGAAAGMSLEDLAAEAGRRAHRGAPLHQGPARPRPRHPDLRRAAALGIPALAERALRVLLLRGLLARLPASGLPARAAGLRGPGTALRVLTRGARDGPVDRP